jgi:hypothetical protein
VATKPANTRLKAALFGQMRALWILRSIDFRGANINPPLVELCSFGFVANRSPSVAGSATRHSQQPYMVKSLAALAMSALLGGWVLALPGFAPEVKADEVVALAMAGRIAIHPVAGNCASQILPNVASSCLRQTGSDTAVREARLVTARREP